MCTLSPAIHPFLSVLLLSLIRVQGPVELVGESRGWVFVPRPTFPLSTSLIFVLCADANAQDSRKGLGPMCGRHGSASEYHCAPDVLSPCAIAFICVSVCVLCISESA